MELIKSNSVTNECLATSGQQERNANHSFLFGIRMCRQSAPLGNINSKQCNGRLLGNFSCVQREALFQGGLKLTFVTLRLSLQA